jgi:hypothetical protein
VADAIDHDGAAFDEYIRLSPQHEPGAYDPILKKSYGTPPKKPAPFWKNLKLSPVPSFGAKAIPSLNVLPNITTSKREVSHRNRLMFLLGGSQKVGNVRIRTGGRAKCFMT